jgi:hypothetical protein
VVVDDEAELETTSASLHSSVFLFGGVGCLYVVVDIVFGADVSGEEVGAGVVCLEERSIRGAGWVFSSSLAAISSPCSMTLPKASHFDVWLQELTSQ